MKWAVETLQSYDFIEVFAGKALTSSVVRKSGRNTAALDIDYFDSATSSSEKKRSNYFDLMSSSGFLTFGWPLVMCCIACSFLHPADVNEQEISFIAHQPQPKVLQCSPDM